MNTTTLRKITGSISIFCLLFVAAVCRADIDPDLLKAAEKGDAEAQYSVARSYQLGKRVKSDRKKSLYWYSKAAEQGHIEASYRLGLIYYRGIGGYTIDHKKAFKYLSQAAKANHKRSQTHLAKMYEKGEGVERSEVLSDYWYEQAFSAHTMSLDKFLKQRAAEEADDAADEEADEEVVKAAPVKRQEKPQPVAKSVKIKSFPASITSKRWTENGKPATYLRSKTTRCKKKSKKLVCTSAKLTGIHQSGAYKYKVKSIITSKSGNNIQIIYRKLYLSVPSESIGGYDDDIDEPPVENANTLNLGWEKVTHKIPCHFESAKSILCRPVGKDAFYFRVK